MMPRINLVDSVGDGMVAEEGDTVTVWIDGLLVTNPSSDPGSSGLTPYLVDLLSCLP